MSRDRLAADAEALRRQQLADPAAGQSEFDYRQMHELLMFAMSRIKAIAGDPNGLAIGGIHNEKMLSAFKGLLDTATKIVSQLNKMRNSDRLTTMILQQHTAAYAQAVAPILGDALREIDRELHELVADIASTDEAMSETGIIDAIALVREKIRRLSSERIPQAFSSAAETTLTQSKIEHKIH